MKQGAKYKQIKVHSTYVINDKQLEIDTKVHLCYYVTSVYKCVITV